MENNPRERSMVAIRKELMLDQGYDDVSHRRHNKDCHWLDNVWRLQLRLVAEHCG